MVRRCILFFSLALFGCFADLLSKLWIFNKIGMPGENPPLWILDNVFGFQTSLNEGGLFGLGQGFVPVLSFLSFLAVGAIVIWFFKTAHKSRCMSICLGMITGGILGNLYDRLGLHGLKWTEHCYPEEELIGQNIYAVRDWILVMIGSWPWPNFNIADALLVCGVGILLVYSFIYGEESEESTSETK